MTADAMATASEVAAMLGTTPKIFRRFLRDETSTFRPVGQGKRYTFSPRDVAAAKRLFPIWQAAHTRKPKGEASVPAQNGQARAEALDAKLKAAGLHVSQHAA
jgi:hypothetical protein